MKKIFISLCLTAFSVSASFAQTEVPKGWHLLSPAKDSLYGIDLNSAYQFLKDKNRKSTPVIVAVLDSGADTAHEDLKHVLWTNPKEIPGNGIDDDHNGYVDDVHGWNFLGGKDGRNIKKASDERSRVYHKYKDLFLNKQVDTTVMTENEKYIYDTWMRSAADINVTADEQVQLMYVEVTAKAIKKHDKVIQEDMGKAEYTIQELEKYQPVTDAGKKAKLGFLSAMKLLNIEAEEKNTTIISQLDEYVDSKKAAVDAKDTPPYDYRADIIKDDYNNLQDRFYGNNDVMGPTPTHATHVSGIIAAQRNNGVGMDGVADNVQIMLLRVVPDGDEYDKDIALAIRYAVDNGAKVINMSFGKAYSPEKNWVDSAVLYAASKDVLIVHAAGNESMNTDEKDNYPNPYLKAPKFKAPNFITVGASSDPKMGGSLVADFSNYGKESVDVFAPGVRIYSTMPGGNQYGFQKGTSMACPVVAGVAALIRSYYPQLSAAQVKAAIETSVSIPPADVPVIKPGTTQKVSMSDLCKTGGFVSAYGAVEAADAMKPAPQPSIIQKPQMHRNKFNLPKSSVQKEALN